MLQSTLRATQAKRHCVTHLTGSCAPLHYIRWLTDTQGSATSTAKSCTSGFCAAIIFKKPDGHTSTQNSNKRNSIANITIETQCYHNISTILSFPNHSDNKLQKCGNSALSLCEQHKKKRNWKWKEMEWRMHLSCSLCISVLTALSWLDFQ